MADLRALVAAAGAFHVTDRAMRAAQKKMERALAAGDPAPADVAAYLDAVHRYFAPYLGEAEGQLKYVDRRLADLYQQQYNLTAERGVVVKRIESVRGVLGALAEQRAG